jgi:SAM-dependent methyltransferase
VATEGEKILPRVLSYLKGKSVLDLGCGGTKIVPWAVGVDDAREWSKKPPSIDIASPIDPDHSGVLVHELFVSKRPQFYDVLFSSHALEHVKNPILETLRYWLSFVKPGGKMILYLPSEVHYKYDPANPKVRNPAHAHFLTMEVFMWYLEQLKETSIDLFEPDIGPDRYSFLVVLSKLS